MSNFTKSIVYSAAVLAVGLIAIFAIYNNMADQPGVSGLEPAAGEEAVLDAEGAVVEGEAAVIEEGAAAVEGEAVVTEEGAAAVEGEAAVEGAIEATSGETLAPAEVIEETPAEAAPAEEAPAAE